MSGEFGVRFREVMNLPYSTAKEMSFLNYFQDEIQSLYEAACSQEEYERVEDLHAAVKALDAKAKEKL